ncbi:MAG: hypothetical protein JRI23_34425 [Deltaproteobacteria bacterium]|jgi:hypothetical protein|nr:hypothetical protein [Deltaproteobacteria bacterium]MBW2537395.1 hypothetical protein [Deltaproteobacteria bacterium]
MFSARWSGVVAGLLALAGCGDDSEPGGEGGTTAATTSDGGATSTTTASGGAGGGGGAAGSCSATCSDHGTCVLVDGAPTCACEPGYYPVSLECLADPCEQGGTCYYVDADSGSDTADGSLANPWQTIDRVEAAAPNLVAGDYVLFRRGGQWTAQGSLDVRNVTGTEGEPITYGAYGPVGDPLPQFRAIRVRLVSHVTLRDLESVGSDGGPCLNVSEADHVIVQGVTAHDCQSNGIHFGSQASHGVMIDNLVYDVLANDALVVHSPMDLTEQTKVGDHFWIVDNRVPGPVAEQPVDVATGSDTVPGSRDIKVVGNRLSRGGNGCVALGHGTSVAWVVGNWLGNCTATETAYAIGVGGTHLANSGTHHRISGNVVFYNLMSAVNTYGESPAVVPAWIEHNTFVSVIGRRPVFRAAYEGAEIAFSSNVVWTTGNNAHVGLVTDTVITAMDHNWYVPETDPACSIDGRSLVEWQGATGFDAHSSCSAVPGLSLPSQGEVDDFDGWTDSSFLAHFVPDSEWEGCPQQIGAIRCDGSQRIEIEPIPDYPDNGGLGWTGPLIVKQRYPLTP